jgi:hypothetical protein
MRVPYLGRDLAREGAAQPRPLFRPFFKLLRRPRSWSRNHSALYLTVTLAWWTLASYLKVVEAPMKRQLDGESATSKMTNGNTGLARLEHRFRPFLDNVADARVKTSSFSTLHNLFPAEKPASEGLIDSSTGKISPTRCGIWSRGPPTRRRSGCTADYTSI